MDLSLGFLFCSIGLYFCFCASTILSWLLWLCSRVWSQAGWFFQFHSSFSRLLWLFEKDGNDNLICKTEKETQMYRTEFWTMGEDEGGMIWENRIETCILSSVKQIVSPGWMHETSAWGWCTGMTHRDVMGREVGGASEWGTHVNPWLIHVNVWQKPLQYCKVISLQLMKIIGKKTNIEL